MCRGLSQTSLEGQEDRDPTSVPLAGVVVVADYEIGPDALECVFENETAPSIQGASVVILREANQVY